jgi:hypothetical protein
MARKMTEAEIEEKNKVRWLAAFKEEFLRRSAITWNEGAGQEDAEAFRLYYPNNVTEAVRHYMEKYNLDDGTMY